MAVAVMAATHSTTTFAATAGGSCGRNERGGADGGDGSGSENCLANHESLSLVFLLDVISHPARLSGERSVRSTAR
jgi:hypothetical protein